MTKHQIEVITSVERRRRWSREEQERLVGATFEPGKCFGACAIGRHSCEPAFPVAQRALPDLRAARAATRSGASRRGAASAATTCAATADRLSAQEEQHGDDRAWRRYSFELFRLAER